MSTPKFPSCLCPGSTRELGIRSKGRKRFGLNVLLSLVWDERKEKERDFRTGGIVDSTGEPAILGLERRWKNLETTKSGVRQFRKGN